MEDSADNKSLKNEIETTKSMSSDNIDSINNIELTKAVDDGFNKEDYLLERDVLITKYRDVYSSSLEKCLYPNPYIDNGLELVEYSNEDLKIFINSMQEETREQLEAYEQWYEEHKEEINTPYKETLLKFEKERLDYLNRISNKKRRAIVSNYIDAYNSSLEKSLYPHWKNLDNYSDEELANYIEQIDDELDNYIDLEKEFSYLYDSDY